MLKSTPAQASIYDGGHLTSEQIFLNANEKCDVSCDRGFQLAIHLIQKKY